MPDDARFHGRVINQSGSETIGQVVPAAPGSSGLVDSRFLTTPITAR
jgi:hypothetical protein